jgi:hypothetical protein
MEHVASRVGRALLLGVAWSLVTLLFLLAWSLIEFAWTFSFAGPELRIEWSRSTLTVLAGCVAILVLMWFLAQASHELLDCVVSGVACGALLAYWLAAGAKLSGHPASVRLAMKSPVALPALMWGVSVWRVVRLSRWRAAQAAYGNRSSGIRETNGT